MRKEHIFGDYDRPKCNIIIHEFSRNNNKKGQTLSETAVAQAGQHVPICYKVMIKFSHDDKAYNVISLYYMYIS